MSMWVDKYKPQGTGDLLGQSRNVVRMKQWLRSFEATRSKPLFIYGPPGIGKTTAAHLCCKEAGYHTVEFNASDQRNKNIIKDVISTVAGTSRLNFFGRASETKDAIILDEVDGMAGNEDRGGIGQLIIELKNTKKPMIFICNDGQHQKLRALKEKCEIIEFKRPDYDVIRALVNKIARAENLKLDKIDVQQLADSSDFDIRQIVNSLSLFEDGDTSQIAKTTRLNAFEATKKALTNDRKGLDERFECFFADYNIMPLFMFENYHKCRPIRGDPLKAVSMAADSFCWGDLADKEIRSRQNWSLLQTQGLCTTVIPSKLMQSNQPPSVGFPSFLGKLSNANKRLRLTQELNAHMCLTVRGGLDADYLDAFRERLSAPLLAKEKLGGIDAIVDFMHDYALLKDDLNSIMELATWSFKPDPMAKVDTKTKTALTNLYKKRSVALPYFVDDQKAAKKRKPAGFGIEAGEEEEADEEEEDDNEPVKLRPKKVTKNDKPPAAKKASKATKDKETKATQQKETKATQQKETKASQPKYTKASMERESKPAKSNGKKGEQNGKAVITLDSDDDDVQILPKPRSYGGVTADKRPPAPPNGGISRFFQPKKQKS